MPEFDRRFDHERLEVFHDAGTGATGAIAIHSTALGPAMGGLRLCSYGSLDDAVADALRLARAMSLKNAAAGLDLGGGKAVILDDGGWDSPEARAERMRAVGRTVEELAGRYITAEDVGTTPRDMERIAEATRWVAGRPVECGGHGDPSPLTARTVFAAIATATEHRLGASGLDGVRVGVLGVGNVGAALAGMLRRAGAEVVVADAAPGRADEVAGRVDARAVEVAGFLALDVDVLAPCALGEVIDRDTVASLRCAIVAGAANNPLTTPEVADDLARAGILYVPDFVANCGGIIHVGGEALGLDDDEVERLLERAEQRTGTLLRKAAATGRTPWAVAVAQAEARIAAAPPERMGAVA
jgi:glutamate dehydrogenase/leucine dehydrogenase